MRMGQLLIRRCSAASTVYRAQQESCYRWHVHTSSGQRRRGRSFQSTLAVSTLDAAAHQPLLTPIERCRALVLDSSYRPINVINWQRAICLDFLDKVDVLEYYNVAVQSASTEFLIPAVLRVRMYVRKEIRGGHLALSRRNLMIRDMWTCQYCGAREDLTLDHLVPTSAGGKWAWDNLVTACTACNGAKGNKPLEQLGWTLRKQPSEPSAYEFGILLGLEMGIKATPKEWNDYLLPLNRMAPPRQSRSTLPTGKLQKKRL